MSEHADIPNLEGWHGRPILYSVIPCWYSNYKNENKLPALLALIMGVLYMLVTAMLSEGIRSLREALEAEAVLIISHNTVDVNAPQSPDCKFNDNECVRVVEEVVSPVITRRCSWKHTRNTLLYGAQCAMQLQLLYGVLSLNVCMIASVVIGILLGRLLFHWRPRIKPKSPGPKKVLQELKR